MFEGCRLSLIRLAARLMNIGRSSGKDGNVG